MNLLRRFLGLWVIFFAACGGGGSSNTNTSQTPAAANVPTAPAAMKIRTCLLHYHAPQTLSNWQRSMPTA